MTNTIRIGFVGGGGLPGNVLTFLENLRRLLKGRSQPFEYDLVVAEGVDLPQGYDRFDPGIPEADTARGELVGLLRALRRYARDHRPDVLFQVTRFPTHGTATAVAGLLTRTPTITRFAGDNFNEHRYANSVGEQLRTYALKNCIGLVPVQLADAIVALGPQGREQLARRFRRGGVYTIPQPVDTDRFTPVPRRERARIRSSLGMPGLEESRVLLTVGRVSRRKGMVDLRTAARRLERESVQWFVVGEGPMRESVADVPSVEPVGRVPHDEIAAYYRAADLYVHLSHHEGLPNTLLESTACGTPAVARDVGECGEVAVDTFTTLDELWTLLDRRYGRVSLGDRFDSDRLARRYDALLREVAS